MEPPIQPGQLGTEMRRMLKVSITKRHCCIFTALILTWVFARERFKDGKRIKTLQSLSQ